MEVSTMLVGWGWTFDEIKAGWIETEELGYDAAYMGDDIFPHAYVESDYDINCYEPWTILPAMAAVTKRMRIGTTVTPCGRRHPGLFAKITTNTDIISGGRLTVGMGAGNAPAQQKSFGQPYLKATERTAMLREELEILRSMWTQDRTTFKGEYYQVENAINSPKPVRQPHPEVLLGFKSKKFLPPLAAEYADRANLFGSDDDEISEVMEVLAGHCKERGRDFDAIVKSRCASIIFTDDEVADKDAELERRAAILDLEPEAFKAEHNQALISYVGPADGCAEALKKRTADLGINEIVILIETIDKNTHERTMNGLRTFAKQVMPKLKSY